MYEYVGIVRTEEGLLFAKNEVKKIERNLNRFTNNAKHYFEDLNMEKTENFAFLLSSCPS